MAAVFPSERLSRLNHKYASRRKWVVSWEMIGGFLAGVALSILVAAVLDITKQGKKAKRASAVSKQEPPE